MGLVQRSVLVAVEKGGERPLPLGPFAGLWDKDSFAPEVDKVVLAFGRVEEQEVEVHRTLLLYHSVAETYHG